MVTFPVCAPCAGLEHRGQKEAAEPPELDLVMSGLADAEAQTHVLWRSSQCS